MERDVCGRLIVVTGPKGADKDTVIHELGIPKIVSFTTHEPRLEK